VGLVAERIHPRKLVLTGRATYTVSLPKKWVARHGLGRGSLVYLVEKKDGSLLVLPAPSGGRGEEHLKVSVEIKPEENSSVERLLIAFYEAGYETIKLIQRPYITDEFRENLRSALSRLSGLEVIEEASNYVVLQCMIDSYQVGLEKTLERMEVLVRSMLSDLLAVSKEFNAEILRGLVDRDNELDKFFFLLSKQVTLLLRRRDAGVRLGVESPVLALPYKSYGRCLEEMGDVLTSLARYCLSKKVGIDKELVDLMRQAFSNAIRTFKTGDAKYGKRVSYAYTEFFDDYAERGGMGDYVVMCVGRFLGLCVDVVEARIELDALMMSEKRS